MSGKILLVEDEHSIADPVIYNLKQEGFSVTHVDEGPIALEIFGEESFDLIIFYKYKFLLILEFFSLL